MTFEQKRAFLKAVVGKKIRWSDWPKDEYFIPKSVSEDSIFGYHHGMGEYILYTSMSLMNGFGLYKTSTKRWLFVDKEPIKSHLPDFL